jgi:hypothetical protein
VPVAAFEVVLPALRPCFLYQCRKHVFASCLLSQSRQQSGGISTVLRNQIVKAYNKWGKILLFEEVGRASMALPPNLHWIVSMLGNERLRLIVWSSTSVPQWYNRALRRSNPIRVCIQSIAFLLKMLVIECTPRL